MAEGGGSYRPLWIATCPVNWNNNDLPGWRFVTPFPAILDRMREAGYRATEYDGLFGTDVASVRAELQSRDMVLTGSYQWIEFLKHGDNPGAYDFLEPTLQFLSDIECHNLIVSDPLRPQRVAMAGRVAADGSDSLDHESYQRLADGVHTVASIAHEFDIRVRYHNHVGSWIEAPHEVEALLSHLDTAVANLCFDTGHYAYGGGNPRDFIRDNIGSIGYLHLKDVDPAALASARARKLTFLEALREIVFAPIGTGPAGIAEILSSLIENSFEGWIVVEQDTCAGDPTEAARTNFDFIQQSLNVMDTTGR